MRIEVSVIRDDGSLASKWVASPLASLQWMAQPGMAIVDQSGELSAVFLSCTYREATWRDRIGDFVRPEKK